MRTIAVTQATGGAGASTVSAHLAWTLAESGYSTLLLDLAPSGGSAAYLGIRPRQGAPDLWDVLTGRKEIHAATVKLGESRNLFVVPSAERLAGHECELRGANRLRVALAPLKRQGIDCVVLDTGSRHVATVRHSLAASTDALVVAETKAQSLDALEIQSRMIAEPIEVRRDGPLKLLGIVPSRVTRTRLSRATLEALRARYADEVLTPIRDCSGVAEAPLFRVPVTASAPESIGAQDFRQLTRAVLERLGWRRRAERTRPTLLAAPPLRVHDAWRRHLTEGGDGVWPPAFVREERPPEQAASP